MTVTEDLDRSVKLTAEGKWNEARKILIRLARKGVMEAQFNLGLIYFNGYDVKPDYGKALKWYTKAADQGMPEAQV
ncbi:MAG: tetratricopeptide repeat protein, partial [Methanomethylophilus sp.]|nr:tetratricopeptide repeat protein [Methanomethylophilus sp.]